MQANRFVPAKQLAGIGDLGRPGLALVESGDLAGFEKMHRELIELYAPQNNDHIMQQLFMGSLLCPADDAMLHSLAPHADKMAKSVLERPGILKPWQLLDLALFEYRRGNFSKSLEWADRFLADPTPFLDHRQASVHCIAAMAAQCQCDNMRARTELAAARQLMAKNPKSDPQSHANEWWHWAFVRIFLREAEEIVESSSQQ